MAQLQTATFTFVAGQRCALQLLIVLLRWKDLGWEKYNRELLQEK